MAKTKTQLLVEGFLVKGYTEKTIRSKKYRAFEKDGRTYYVGRGGALRMGATASSSISMIATGVPETLIRAAKAAEAV